MRTDYTLDGQTNEVWSGTVNDAKNYHLPHPNYLKLVPIVPNFSQRRLQRDVDGTYQRLPPIPMKEIDIRKQKM